MRADDIEFVRGDTPTITVTIVDVNDDIFDLTGYTVQFTLKENVNDANANAAIAPATMTVDDPEIGVATITLTYTQTDLAPGIYWYDIQVNDGTNYHTVVGPAKCKIIDDVTK